MMKELRKQLERNQSLLDRVAEIIASGTNDEQKIKEADDLLNMVSKWQSLNVCRELCRYGQWHKAAAILGAMDFPDIEPTERNTTDYIAIEFSALNAAMENAASMF